MSSCVSWPPRFKVIFTVQCVVLCEMKEAMLIVTSERTVRSLRMFLNNNYNHDDVTLNILWTAGGIWSSIILLIETIIDHDGGDDDDDYDGCVNDGGDKVALPLKSWYIPGTMMMAMASSLLKVRKI